MQALYLLALLPIAETKADPNSYGFRPKRSTADAIEQCFLALAKEKSPVWALEGDIKGCFDHIMMPTKSKNKGRSSFFIKREPLGNAPISIHPNAPTQGPTPPCVRPCQPQESTG